ncbi:MAG: branched-chain amino acid transporter substrate-binding protein [Solirubrobacterales bacterium]|nr:branched-chain amino acid transporter substrate-binding protein [Solirubrobacterales bacterium]
MIGSKRNRRTHSRRWIAVVAALSLALTFAACEGAGDDDESAESDEPVVVGASLPLTGPLSVPGQGHVEGYELCAEKLNEGGGILDREVELKTSDNRSDTETVVNQTERFLSVDDVDMVLGTFSTLLSFPASAITEQNQKIYWEPSDSSVQSHSRGFEYNYGFTLKPIDYIGETPTDAVFELAEAGDIPENELPTSAAVVYTDDFFTNAMARGLIGGVLEVPGVDPIDFGEGYLAERDMELVLEQQVPKSFNDWTGLLNRVKDSGAEYFFGLMQAPAEVDIAKAMKTVGYEPKAAFFAQGTYPEFADSVGDAADGLIVWSTWGPEVTWEGELHGQPYSNQDFVADFKAKFNKEPNEDNAQSFAVCQAMAYAAEEAGTIDNTEIKTWLDERTAEDPIPTIQGDYFFDEDGLTAERDVLLRQWQDGELKHIFPQGEEYPDQAKIQYPTRG